MPSAHDRLDSSLQIPSRYPCYASQRRLQIQLTNLEDSFGVVQWIDAPSQHLLIAGPFALLHQSRPEPPHQRMKPKHRLDQHVNGAGKIVAAADVAKLVNNHRSQ